VSHELRQRLRLAEVSHGPALRQQQHGSSSSQHRAAESDVVGFSNLYSWGNGANLTLGTGERQQGSMCADSRMDPQVAKRVRVLLQLACPRV
jgi:hypothetical protein